MLQRILDRLLLRRHFWRYATFGEVADLYASRLLRLFALKFIGVFTSVFLLKLGYDLVFLGLFWAAFYFIKVLFAWPSARIAAHFGPKHGTLYSNILSAIALIFLPFVPTIGLPALIAWCMLQAFSSCLNDLCYLIDFSKVKTVEYAGKEIGYMNIIEKVAAGLSPVIGGVVAALFGPIVAMVLSAIMFLLSAVPLFRTAEPVRLRQKLQFRSFPWRMTLPSIMAEASIGYDVFATGSAWMMYITVVLFAADHNEVYAKIGVFTSLTLVIAMIASHIFGKLIDRRQGLLLLQTNTVINSLAHLSRPFVTSIAGVVGTGAVNDVATTGYSMAFTRGMFDTADLSGHRIVYLFLIEVAINAGAALSCLAFAFCLSVYSQSAGFMVYFISTAIITLGIGFPRFMLYRK